MSWDCFYYFSEPELDREALREWHQRLKKTFGAAEYDDDDADADAFDDESGSMDFAFSRFSFTVTAHPAGSYVHLTDTDVEPGATDEAEDAMVSLQAVLGLPLAESEWADRVAAHEKRQR
jgi:hypothetical protein